MAGDSLFLLFFFRRECEGGKGRVRMGGGRGSGGQRRREWGEMRVWWGACKEREGQGSCHHTLVHCGVAAQVVNARRAAPLRGTAWRRKHQVGPFGREAVGETGVPGRGRLLGILREGYESPSGRWTLGAHVTATARGPQPFTLHSHQPASWPVKETFSNAIIDIHLCLGHHHLLSSHSLG